VRLCGFDVVRLTEFDEEPEPAAGFDIQLYCRLVRLSPPGSHPEHMISTVPNSFFMGHKDHHDALTRIF